MFAPAERRPELFALLLLGQELAKISEQDREPMLAMIRFQWWRDALGGAGGSHPIIGLLQPVIGKRLGQQDVIALLDAREAELDWQRPQTMAQLERQIAATAGQLQWLAARILGETDPGRLQAVRRAGTAYGLVGTVRSHSYNFERGQSRMPEEFDGASAEANATGALLKRARTIVAELRKERRANRRAIAAFLPATIADVQAEAMLRHSAAGAGPMLPLRLLIAAWRCRV
jgi:phytoene synthase